MLVRYWMSKKLTTILPTTNLRDALSIMDINGIRRLPIVLEKNRLVGFVTKSDIQSNLSDDKVNSEYSTVSQIMNEKPYTCKMNTAIETVGVFMRKKRIGGLPVLSDGRLVGVITESDVLGAMAAIAHWGSRGERICLRINNDNIDTSMKNIVSLTSKHDMSLLCLLSHGLPNSDELIVTIRVHGANVPLFKDALLAAGYEILHSITHPDSGDNEH